MKKKSARKVAHKSPKTSKKKWYRHFVFLFSLVTSVMLVAVCVGVIGLHSQGVLGVSSRLLYVRPLQSGISGNEPVTRAGEVIYPVITINGGKSVIYTQNPTRIGNPTAVSVTNWPTKGKVTISAVIYNKKIDQYVSKNYTVKSLTYTVIDKKLCGSKSSPCDVVFIAPKVTPTPQTSCTGYCTSSRDACTNGVYNKSKGTPIAGYCPNGGVCCTWPIMNF